MKKPESRERVLRAVSHRQPDRVPCDYIGTLEVDRKLKDYFGIPEHGGIKVMEGGSRWNPERAESMEGVLRKLGVDLRQVEPVYCGPPLERMPDGSHKDIWGAVYRKISNEYGTYDEAVGWPLAELKTVDDVRNYSWPSPDWYDYGSVREQCSYYEGCAIKAGHPGVMDLINGVSRGRGMQQVLTDIALRDPAGLAIFEKRFDFFYEYTRRMLETAGGMVDIFWIGDDYGTQRGLMISPRTWREVFKPYLKRMIDLIHSFDVKVMFHSCGSTVLIWDDLVELGLDIYQTIQERAEGMDPEALKSKYGRKLCLHGAVDSQGFLQAAAPGEVRKTVLRRIRNLNRDGGYICASSHNLQPDIPVENIIAMYEAVSCSRGH